MKIRELRTKCGMNQKEFAAILNVAPNTYNQWETGKRQPDYNVLKKMADYFDVSIDYLVGRTDISHPPRKGVRIPVYGNVAADVPILAIENYDSDDPDDWEEIDEKMAANGEYIALRIKGDSMEPKISTGDVVIIRIQPDAETGDIVVAMVNGDEATVKKLKKRPEGILLIPSNPKYEPMFYTNEDIENLPVRILGRVVELRAKF